MTLWESISFFFDFFGDFLKDVLVYDRSAPLNFIDPFFWYFFAIVLGYYSYLHPYRFARNAFLFFASLFFYYKSSGFFFFLLIFSTISDYLIGFNIHGARKKSWRTFWLVVSVVINLALLSYFKYALFFTDSFNFIAGTAVDANDLFPLATERVFDVGSGSLVTRMLMPVGISFFTFQTISYAVDIYKGKIAPVKNILDFGFYVSFFPQLVAGPIVRAAEFIPQLYKPYRLSKNDWGLSIFWILKGLLKKVILADFLAVQFMDPVFDQPMMFTGFENLMSLYGYSLQVYADFSGYTDIAIGVSLLLGFRLPQNFNYPYLSKSVGEFWKRWHISLSTWLKDYLYFPLGGSKGSSFLTWAFVPICMVPVLFLVGVEYVTIFIFAGVVLTLLFMAISYYYPKFKQEIATNLNLLITMLLGGLWHGSSWLFVIWGGLNGLGLVVYKLWRRISPYEKIDTWYVNAWRIFLTLTFITFTRIWFRHTDMDRANEMMFQIANNFRVDLIPDILLAFWYVFAIMIAGYIMHWLPSRIKQSYQNAFIAAPMPLKILAGVVVIFLVFQALAGGGRPFIYFQF